MKFKRMNPAKHPSITLGRKFCIKCKRWRLIVDFPPHTWYRDGTIKYVQAYCRGCNTRGNKKRWRSLTPDERLARAEYERRHHARSKGNALPEDVLSGDRVAVESFRPIWEELKVRERDFWRRETNWRAGAYGRKHSLVGRLDTEAFASWMGITVTEYATIMKAMSPSGQVGTLPLELVDRILTTIGWEHKVALLYVVPSQQGNYR